jgi:hypothetical protein
MSWNTERQFFNESFAENVYEIPDLLEEILKVAAENLQKRPRRKKVRVELDIDIIKSC